MANPSYYFDILYPFQDRVIKVINQEDGSIRLVPKMPVDRALAEKYQLADINWAVKQKGKKK